MGCVYKRKQSRFWYIAWTQNKKQHVQSARTTNHELAAKLLATREGEAAPFFDQKPVIPRRRRLDITAFKNVKDGPGWVYVIRIKDGPTKIGVTTRPNPFERIRNVQCELPYETELIGFARSEKALALEGQLHNHFSGKWIRGEWFQLTTADLIGLLMFGEFRTALNPAEHTQKVLVAPSIGSEFNKI